MKKIIVLVLALAIMCISFVGCDQYSDSDPMSEKRVDKFLEAKKEQVEDVLDNWGSIEMSIDIEQTVDGQTTAQKYTTILDTKSKTYSIDMTQLGAEYASFGVAYLKGDYCYFDSEELGKVKVDISSEMDLSAFIDFSSQLDNYLFVFEELDAEELAELEVELFVTKTDDDGELYRFEFSKEYYEYLLEEGPAKDALSALGDTFSSISDAIKFDNLDFEEYVITFEFDEDGELIEMKEIVDVTVDIDMTAIYESMGLPIMSGMPTTVSTSTKGESVFRMVKDKIEIDDSEYQEIK